MTRTTRAWAASLAGASALAVLLLIAGGIVGGSPVTTATTVGGSSADAVSTVAALPGADHVNALIGRAQDRLRLLPGDYVTWAVLGSAYLEQARITADPTLYPKAEAALRRSVELRPDDNPQAITGLGALAVARHDFAEARELARRALDLNPYDAQAYGVLADAETQLGNAGAATEAVQRMLDLRPGVAALTRASYDLELRGRLPDAAALMRRALDAPVSPADVAYCRHRLGELAWQTGDLAEAQRQYTASAAADRSYLPALHSRAKVAAARGQLAAALFDYGELTRRLPTPGYLLEYAELLRAAGRVARRPGNFAWPVRRRSCYWPTAARTT